MDLDKIIALLQAKGLRFEEYAGFSEKPGIYAFQFIGSSFPLVGYNPNPYEVVYIGKTESSQQSRDADTHFADGKTGSSTVRRSLGALLLYKLKLKPLPRSETDIEKGRTTFYVFDKHSEKKLTKWMKNNLTMTFVEFEGAKVELDDLETILIKKFEPVLNIDHKNPNNPYSETIKKARKKTGLMAIKLRDKNKIEQNKSGKQPKKNPTPSGASKRQALYEDLWTEIMQEAIPVLERDGSFEKQLSREQFDNVGDRSKYAFRLDIENGVNTNNIKGSAVARDLYSVLRNRHTHSAVMKEGNLILRMGKKYNFSVIINSK